MSEKFCCQTCGGNLVQIGDMFECEYCRRQYNDIVIERAYKKLENSLKDKFGDLVHEEIVKNEQEKFRPLLSQLWQKSQEKYTDSKAILDICGKIKAIYPDNFLANFYEVANGGTVAQINDFLNGVDVVENSCFIEDIVNFLLKSLEMGNVASLNYIVERAYKNTDMELFEKFSTLIESEAQKVNAGLYKTDLPRDIFVAYSSKDLPQVLKLVETIESQGLTCFLAMRNLRHGRGSVANYEVELQKAIDSCNMVIFVSSCNSRRLDCDAIKVEIPYIKKKDIENIPAGYKNSYTDSRLLGYKKPRIEYRLDNAPSILADKVLKEFFSGLEYCKSIDDVLDRISTILTDGFGERNLESQPSHAQPSFSQEELRKMLEQMQAEEKHREEMLKEEEKLKEQAEKARKEQEIKKNFDIDVNGVLTKYKGQGGRVVIPDSVTSIGDEVFFDCSSLKSVVIPDSVTSIGDSAFSCCSSLTSVEIPDSVTSIGDEAFAGCSSLTSVEIPDSVTSIGISAFEDCGSLKSVVIPDSVTSIGDGAFADCSGLTSVEVSEDNTAYKSINGNLYSKDGKTLIQYAIGKIDSEFIISDGVTSIGISAFYYCSSLTSVVIGDSVTSIGDEVFKGCSSLTSVVIGDSVTSIGDNAFSSCRSLTSVVIPDSVTSIGDSAFAWCSSLTSVVIPDSVTSIGNSAFSNCSSLTSVVIGNSVTSIADDAFSGCRSLTSVVIPDSVTSIGREAFYGCSSLKSVVIPDSVTSIGAWAFKGCSSLTSVVIGDGVTSIGNSAFEDCSSLTSVVIPDSVTSIGDGAFADCSGLTSVEVSEDDTAYKSINGNLYSKDGKTLIQYAIGKTDSEFIISDGVTSIGNRAFYGCSSLTSVVIGDSVTTIDDEAFKDCNNLSVYYNGYKIPPQASEELSKFPVYIKDTSGNWVQVKKTFFGWKPVK